MASEDLPVLELAFPGPLRDSGIAAILAGEKTALTGLLQIHQHAGEPVPKSGQRFSVVDSAGRPAAVIELTDVRVVAICEVDDDYARAEGRGYADAAQWRQAHEEFFRSPGVAAFLGTVPEISDSTLVVTERFRLVRPEHIMAPHPATELTVPVTGGHLWADDTGGNGLALVLLHPGWGDSSIWLPVLDRLPERFRVIRYDTRGFGRSPAPAAPFTQLGDLIAVLDHCGADRVIVVGHSGGGGTAIGLALADPARVRGLLLLAPGVQDYPWPPDDPYGRAFGALFAAGDRVGIAELGLRTWAAAGADPAAQAQVNGAADAYFRLGDYERPDPPAYDRLGQVRAPSVIVTGDLEYPMVARCAADIAAKIPGCQQITAPGADHLLPLRIPALIADLAAQMAEQAS
jgi:3-oxoadipate enol-lactonase